MYATDTHSLLWFLTNDSRLGPRAKEIFRRCDRGEVIIIIPSIVLLESLYLCEKRKIEVSFLSVIKMIEQGPNYRIYPLNKDVVVRCMIKLKDPHDRIIVATAQLLNIPLITKDEHIKNSGVVPTIW